MKIIFTLDQKDKRRSPEFYNSVMNVIKNEKLQGEMGLTKIGANYVTSVMVTGDVDAIMFISKMARSYNQNSIIIVNDDFNALTYNLKTHTMEKMGLWVVTKKQPEVDHSFFDGNYYQISSFLPQGAKWN